MVLIGSRPRYVVARKIAGNNLIEVLKSEARAVRFVLFGRPSTKIVNASRTYIDNRHLIEDFLRSEDSRLRFSRFRYLAVADAAIIGRSIRIAAAWAQATLLVGVLLIGVGMFWIVRYMHQLSWPFVTTIAIFAILHSVIVFPSLYNNVSPMARGLQCMLAVWMLASSIVVYRFDPGALVSAWRSRPLSMLEAIGLACLVMAAVSVLTVFLAIILNQAIRITTHRLSVKEDPEATIVGELLWAATLLEAWGQDPIYPGARYLIVDSIEVAAQAMENGLPQYSFAAGPPTRGIVERRLASAAEAIRMLQCLIILEDGPSRDRVRSTLISVVEAVIAGRYAEFPTITALELEERRSVLRSTSRGRLLKGTRDVLVGGIPLVATIALGALPVELPAGAGGAMVTLAATWFLIKVISALDPSYRESLSDIRSLAESHQK